MAISGALQSPHSHPITEPFAPVINRILRRTDLSNGAKLAYGRLHQYAGRDGRAWPRISTLARELGASERQTSRYLSELRRKGLIRTERRYYGGPNNYILTDLEPQMVQPAPAPDAPGKSPDPEPKAMPEKEPKPAVDGNHAISGRIDLAKSGDSTFIEENKNTTTPSNLVPFPERASAPVEPSLSFSDSLPADSIEETPDQNLDPDPEPVLETAAPVETPAEIDLEKGIEETAADPTPAADALENTTPESSPAEIAALIGMIPPHVIRTPSLEEMVGKMARRHGFERVERNIRYANTFSRTSYRGFLALSITGDWAAPWDEEQKEILRRQMEKARMEAEQMAALQQKRREEEERAADRDAGLKARLAEAMSRPDFPELEAAFAGQLTGITRKQYQRRGLESTVVAMAFVEFVDRIEGRE